MSILSELSQLVGAAFVEEGYNSTYGEVVVSQRPDLCQFQCNGAMPAVRSIDDGVGRNPRELADAIVSELEVHESIKEATVAGPGFINLTVTDESLAQNLVRFTTGFDIADSELLKVLIDYGGGNIAKSLHVGHLRPGLIGESLKRAYRLAGYETIGDYHLGDWGLPMGQLIAAIGEQQPELPYFDEGFKGPYPEESPVTIEDLERIYPEASSKAKANPEFMEKARLATVHLQEGRAGYVALWEHFRDVSVASMKDIYDALGIHFDLWLGEASVAHRVETLAEELKVSGVAVESEGAYIIDVSDEADKKELPPFMLLNSRGGLTYAATDLATIDERVADFKIDKCVYVVDSRQSDHFKQVFRAAWRSGIAKPETILIHAANGTVNGPDGKPMKTREGNLPRLEDLIQEAQKLAEAELDANNLAQDFEASERAELIRQVGLAALSYGELQNHRTTNYIFDLKRFTQLQGQTGPYIQYVAVRAHSMLGKAAAHGIKPGNLQPPVAASERDLILQMLAFPEVLARTLGDNAPNLIAEYTYEVAASFNRFYDSCHVINEPDPAIQGSWLKLVELTSDLLGQLLGLLCIEVPRRM